MLNVWQILGYQFLGYAIAWIFLVIVDKEARRITHDMIHWCVNLILKAWWWFT